MLFALRQPFYSVLAEVIVRLVMKRFLYSVNISREKIALTNMPILKIIICTLHSFIALCMLCVGVHVIFLHIDMLFNNIHVEFCLVSLQWTSHVTPSKQDLHNFSPKNKFVMLFAIQPFYSVKNDKINNWSVSIFHMKGNKNAWPYSKQVVTAIYYTLVLSWNDIRLLKYITAYNLCIYGCTNPLTHKYYTIPTFTA